MSDKHVAGVGGQAIQRDSEDIRLSLERAFGQDPARPKPPPAAKPLNKTSHIGGRTDYAAVEVARAAFRARIEGSLDETDL